MHKVSFGTHSLEIFALKSEPRSVFVTTLFAKLGTQKLYCVLCVCCIMSTITRQGGKNCSIHNPPEGGDLGNVGIHASQDSLRVSAEYMWIELWFRVSKFS